MPTDPYNWPGGTDAHQWGGGNDTPEQITNAKLNQTTTHFNERIDALELNGNGDMTKAVYDTNDSGTVDNAEAVNGATAAQLRDRSTHTGTQAISTVTGLQTALDAKLDDTQKGAANGLAELGSDGLVPVSQLPPSATGGDMLISVYDTNGNGKVDAAEDADALGGVAAATIQTSISAKIPSTEKGAANGVASLNATGKVPTTQIPSLGAAQITSGTLDIARIPTGTTSTTVPLGNDARFTDARTPTGGAGGVLSGNYPNPGFAVDMATQGELDNHTNNVSTAHTAEYPLTDGATVAVDWNDGDRQYLDTAAGSRTFTFANPVNGGFYALRIKSDGTSRTHTFPTVTWMAGTAPGAVAANKTLLVVLWRSNGAYYGVYKVES